MTRLARVATGFLMIGLSSGLMAQSANQNVTVNVNPVNKIAVSGDPSPLVISSATPGLDLLTAVTDNTTNYSITQNVGGTLKITAEVDAALTAGYALELELASSKGTSSGIVDISNATAGSAVDVVSAIAMGADANQSITYTFSAIATAGTLSASRLVTLTLTN